MQKESALKILKGIKKSIADTQLISGMDESSRALSVRAYHTILAVADREKWFEDADAIKLLPVFGENTVPTQNELNIALSMLYELLR